MNCKKGDLAIIIKSWAGNEGKIVTCLHYIGHIDGYAFGEDDLWKIDRNLRTNIGRTVNVFPDAWLMPIGKKEVQKIKEKELEST